MIPRRDPAWTELAVVAALATLCWGLVALVGSGETDPDDGPLITEHVGQCRIAFDETAYSLLLRGPVPLVGDAAFTPIGRLRADEARAIRDRLASCRIVRRLDVDHRDATALADYGLDRPLRLEIPGHAPLLLGTVDAPHGFALGDDDTVLEISPDLTAVLRRTPAVLRDNALAPPPRLQAIGRPGAWRLIHDRGRWWRDQAEGRDRWLDQELVAAWLEQLDATAATAFVANPGLPARHILRLSGSGTDIDRRIEIADLGPAPDGDGRLIRRSEHLPMHTVQEHLIVDLPEAFLAPPPERFAPRTALPLDPRRADRVRIGAWTLECDHEAKRWTSPDLADLDQAVLDKLLATLAAIERAASAGADLEMAPIEIWQGAWHFALRWNHPVLVPALDALRPWHLRDRRVIPDLERDAVTGLVIQPRHGAPEIYHRDQHGRWPDDVAADIAIILDSVVAARVDHWTGPTPTDKTMPDCTFVISTAEHTWTLRMNADGRLIIPERDLCGRLDAASRAAIIGEIP